MSRRRVAIVPTYFVPLIIVFVVVFSSAVFLDQKIESPAAVILAPKLVPLPATTQLSAEVFRVFDINTGDVVVSVGAEKVVPIASVTKLFAAAELVSTFDLQTTTTIEWADVIGGGEAGKLMYGKQYSYQDLLFPLLIESSNDAATTLVRATSGALIEQMNTHARALGATSTTFSDASGLSDNNVSTARDLQLLLTDAYVHEPHVFDISTLTQYIGPYSGWRNNNLIAGYSGYRGGKHGYTTAANRTLVAVFDEQIHGHVYRLGYIILGSDDLKADFEKLRQFINTSATPG
jgi:D-alanyl-D-alanine carboxypeptidase